jgi:hypothetical protein
MGRPNKEMLMNEIKEAKLELLNYLSNDLWNIADEMRAIHITNCPNSTIKNPETKRCSMCHITTMIIEDMLVRVDKVVQGYIESIKKECIVD